MFQNYVRINEINGIDCIINKINYLWAALSG